MYSPNTEEPTDELVHRVCIELWKACAQNQSIPNDGMGGNLRDYQLMTYGADTTEKFCLRGMINREIKCVSTCLLPQELGEPARISILLGTRHEDRGEGKGGLYIARRVAMVPIGRGSTQQLKSLYSEIRSQVDEIHGTKISTASIVHIVVNQGSTNQVELCFRGEMNPMTPMTPMNRMNPMTRMNRMNPMTPPRRTNQTNQTNREFPRARRKLDWTRV